MKKRRVLQEKIKLRFMLKKELNLKERRINMNLKNLIISTLIIPIGIRCNGDKINTCKSDRFNLSLVKNIDSNYCDPHFGDVLFVSLKDDNCENEIQYNVIISKLYCKKNDVIICRLLDKSNDWKKYVQSGNFNINRQIRIKSIKYNLNKENIIVCDTSSFSNKVMPTFIVEAINVEM